MESTSADELAVRAPDADIGSVGKWASRPPAGPQRAATACKCNTDPVQTAKTSGEAEEDGSSAPSPGLSRISEPTPPKIKLIIFRIAYCSSACT